MKQRCTNPRNHDFSDYGGRGIKVDANWLNDFGAFFAYLGERPKGMTLDRINNNGHYEPGNVRWAGWETQARNRRPPRKRLK